MRQQIDSFNRFIDDISDVIKEYGKFTIVSKDQYGLDTARRDDITYEFRFEDKVYRSAINHKNGDGKNEEVDPMTCRLRDLNYELSIKAELWFREYKGNDPQDSRWIPLEKIKIATLPVMVKSRWCKLS